MKTGTWKQRPDGVIELEEDKRVGGGGGGGATPKEAIILLAAIALIIALIAGFVRLYTNAHSPKKTSVLTL